MIRATAIATLLGLLSLVLYLPAASPAEHFLAQIKTEHNKLEEVLGSAVAWHVLSRALSWQAASNKTPPLLYASRTPDKPNGVPNAVANEMASVNRRLFGNAYFRSVEALATLAAFRLSAMLAWSPWLIAFAVASLADGYLDGLTKSREFRPHDPELFALFASGALVTIFSMAVVVVLPHALHQGVVPAGLISIVAMLARATASFRRSG